LASCYFGHRIAFSKLLSRLLPRLLNGAKAVMLHQVAFIMWHLFSALARLLQSTIL
jgi:hypothetical protein